MVAVAAEAVQSGSPGDSPWLWRRAVATTATAEAAAGAAALAAMAWCGGGISGAVGGGA